MTTRKPPTVEPHMLDLPDPEIPVTVVSTPSGKAQSISLRLFRVTPFKRSQPAGARTRLRTPRPSAKRWRRVSEGFTVRRPSTGPL